MTKVKNITFCRKNNDIRIANINVRTAKNNIELIKKKNENKHLSKIIAEKHQSLDGLVLDTYTCVLYLMCFLEMYI